MDGTGFNAAGAPVALLVDGDNLAAARAGRILNAARTLGSVTVRRVYADVQHLPGWTMGATGFVHRTAGGGKNASDLLLSVEAVDLFWRDGVRHFAIASSDRDLSVVTLYLAERGAMVLGIGEAKAPAAFRHACSRFVVVGEEGGSPVVTAIAPAAAAPTTTGTEPTKVDLKIRKAIESRGKDGEIAVANLGHWPLRDFGVKRVDLPGRGLHTYLAARPALYTTDPRGPEARVRCRW